MAFTVKVKLARSIAPGDIIEVKAKIKHPVTTGLGLNEDATEPYERFFRDKAAEYISLVEVFYDEEKTNSFRMNSASSDDPLLAFKLRADKEAPVRIVVTNYKGEVVEATADVVFA
jgi:hypothetical protein